MQAVGEALRLWRIPEDATIQEDESVELDEARRSCVVLRFVETQLITEKTTTQAARDARGIEMAAGQTAKNSTFGKLGRAMLASPVWKHAFQLVLKKAKHYEERIPNVRGGP